jgi:hypothetical protein
MTEKKTTSSSPLKTKFLREKRRELPKPTEFIVIRLSRLPGNNEAVGCDSPDSEPGYTISTPN